MEYQYVSPEYAARLDHLAEVLRLRTLERLSRVALEDTVEMAPITESN